MNNSLILTANARLAMHLSEQFDAQQQAHGHKVWQCPQIFTLNSWLQYCWQELQDSQLAESTPCLTPFQELNLWEQVISRSDIGGDLLRISETAKTARQAWGLLKKWRIEPNKHLFAQTQDGLAFYAWATEYQRLLAQLGVIDTDKVPDIIAERFADNTLAIVQHIQLAGFDTLTPQIQHLLDTLSNKGCKIEKLAQQTNQASVKKIGLNDTENEIHVMALWAKQQLSHNKDGRIACVVPNLEQLRPDIEFHFSELMSENDFNISIGLVLDSYPIIANAFFILRLIKGNLPLAELSTLLLSPFIGGAESEMTRRAQCDARLRGFGEFTISLRRLKSYAKYCPLLLHFLNKLKKPAREKSPSEWAAIFSQYLIDMGWPGERSLSSQEYQIVQRWQLLLSEFASLENVSPTLSHSQAVQILQQLAHTTLFQAQGSDTPIQILGVLEAVGIDYAKLWVMGLHDEVWPPSPKPNPFIPYSLQRQWDMPHASAEREYQFCQELTKRFSQSAAEVIFSYPVQEQDRELRESPLLKNFDETELQLTEDPTAALQIFASQDMEILEDDHAPAVTSDEKIRGGTFIFQAQAVCPFRAFAQVRLGATGLETPQSGLNAMERGTLLHSCLEYLWKDLQTYKALINLTKDEMNTLIDNSIELALQQHPAEQALGQRFIRIEKRRLHRLIERWLDLEKERGPFTVIAQEQDLKARIANLDINMQVDRIDQLDDGRHIIIDYKTGRTSPNAWFDERPEQPQLPLYCITSPQGIDGIAFGQVRIDDMRFKGIANEDPHIPGVVSVAEYQHEDIAASWQEQISTWQTILERLGNDFCAGKAEVAPKDPVTSCQYCECQNFCRIREHTDD